MARDKLREPVHFPPSLSSYLSDPDNSAYRQRNSDLVHIPHLLRTLKKTAFCKDG